MIIADDDSIYTGYLVNHLRHGFGVRQSSKSIYKGNWHNDKENGQGVMIYLDKSSYNGHFKNGKRHG
tara:strand:+ start:81 stop:281 length:201 start_codon:yes stop_codon:yes gene_type:complete